jgi:hypothetical protein
LFPFSSTAAAAATVTDYPHCTAPLAAGQLIDNLDKPLSPKVIIIDMAYFKRYMQFNCYAKRLFM